jgi:hypothetical protein
MFNNSKINQLFRLPYCTKASNVDEHPQKHFIKHMVGIYKIEIEQSKLIGLKVNTTYPIHKLFLASLEFAELK